MADLDVAERGAQRTDELRVAEGDFYSRGCGGPEGRFPRWIIAAEPAFGVETEVG